MILHYFRVGDMRLWVWEGEGLYKMPHIVTVLGNFKMQIVYMLTFYLHTIHRENYCTLITLGVYPGCMLRWGIEKALVCTGVPGLLICKALWAHWRIKRYIRTASYYYIACLQHCCRCSCFIHCLYSRNCCVLIIYIKMVLYGFWSEIFKKLHLHRWHMYSRDTFAEFGLRVPSKCYLLDLWNFDFHKTFFLTFLHFFLHF